MTDKTYHILGSGISGLVTAYELAKRGNDVRIHEMLNIVGGLARTENHNNVMYDSGPHLFHTNNEEIKKYWFNLVGDQISEPSLYGANYKDGKVYEYPLSLQSMKEQFSAEERKIIKSQLKKIKKENLKSSKNYKEYVSNLSGEYLTDMFFTKYPQKLWGIPTEKLSAKFAPRRIEIRNKHRPFHSGNGKWAGVLKNGCGALSKSLEKNLNNLGVHIEFGNKLIDLKFENQNKNKSERIAKLIFQDNEEILLNDHDVVISTIPITNMAKIFGIKNKLWYRDIKIICFLINKKISLPSKYDWLYFDDDRYPFHRISLQDSFSQKGRPKNHSILSCEIAYSSDENLSSDSILKKRIINLLDRINILKKENIIDDYVINAKNVYPGYFVGYEEELNRVKGKLDSVENIYLHGAPAEYEYCDLQVLTAKSIDLAQVLSKKTMVSSSNLTKSQKLPPAKEFKIDSNQVSQENDPFIIAEIGLNHNGDIEIAKKLIEQAANAGASATKLQSYKIGRISSKVRISRYYEDLVDAQESLPSYLNDIAFDKNKTKELFSFAKKKKITLFSTPFDLESLDMLEQLDCPAYKISSMDIVNIPLIKNVALTNKPMIISTGMSELSDIELAMKTVLQTKNNKIALLHCVSSYPCPASSANINMINSLKNTFNCIVGYSDHTTGIDISISAVALGASIIEKHFTIDRNMDGPDHNFSILKDELENLVRSSKRVKEATLTHRYGILPTEVNTAQNLRRSIFYKKSLSKNHIIAEEDLEIKSPGIGIHPKFIDIVVGRKIKNKVSEDYPVQWEDFN